MEESKVISHMTTDEKLDHIIHLHHALDKKVENMRSGLLGDEFDKGLVKKFAEHESLDNLRHETTTDAIEAMGNKYDSTKSFVKGAFWVIGVLVVVVNIIIAIVK